MTLPNRFAARTPKSHRPRARVIFRTRRHRTGAIIALLRIEGSTALTSAELQATLDDGSVAGRSARELHRPLQLKAQYNQMLSRAASGKAPAKIIDPATTQPLEPNPAITDSFSQAVDLTARAIAFGTSPTDAWFLLAEQLLAVAIDIPILYSADSGRLQTAVAAIRDDRDARLFAELMLDRYNEDD